MQRAVLAPLAAVGIGLLALVLNYYGVIDFTKLVAAPPAAKRAAAAKKAGETGTATTTETKTRIQVDWFTEAAKRNDIAGVRAAVANQSVGNVDEFNSAGQSALYVAALHGHTALCRLLIELGADINAAQADGATPLLGATFSGNELLAVAFVTEFGARLNATNRSGAAPLHGAALLGHLTLLRTLLDRGVDVNTHDESNITALHGAAIHLSAPCCRELLRRGASRSIATVDGHTPLHYACVSDKGDPSAIVETLLDADAAVTGPLDINARDAHGRTPLHLCALRGHNNTIVLLLRRGADGTIVDDTGFTALFSAFPRRDSWVMKAFLDSGAPGINVGNADGEIALHWAARNGFPELTERLLNHSANINHVNKRGESALHVAAQEQFDGVLRVLFARGADALATDLRGRSLLHHGALGGSRLAILMALSKGASLNTATPNDLLTVMHLVCERAPRGLVAELISFGADEARRDALGRTPLHYCVLAVNEYAVEELLNAGADVTARDNAGETPADMMKAWPSTDPRTQPKKRASFAERKVIIEQLLAKGPERAPPNDEL